MVTPADRGLRERRFIAGARPASPFVFACPTLARRCSRLAVSRACAGKHCFANLFRGEPTAHARLGEQEARARRIGLELVPQLLHVDAQVMRLVDIERAPCFAQKVPVRQHHAGMPSQASEQVELNRRQVNIPAVRADQAALQIDFDVVEAQRSRSVFLRAARRMRCSML